MSRHTAHGPASNLPDPKARPALSLSCAHGPGGDFWAVLQAESARKAARRRRFPRSAMPVSNSAREKPSRTPGPCQNRGLFAAKPPRSRHTRTLCRMRKASAYVAMIVRRIPSAPARPAPCGTRSTQQLRRRGAFRQSATTEASRQGIPGPSPKEPTDPKAPCRHCSK